jgi:hypothetical protein
MLPLTMFVAPTGCAEPLKPLNVCKIFTICWHASAYVQSFTLRWHPFGMTSFQALNLWARLKFVDTAKCKTCAIQLPAAAFPFMQQLGSDMCKSDNLGSPQCA